MFGIRDLMRVIQDDILEGEAHENPDPSDVLAEADAQSAVSWASIAAGAVVAAASSLGLLALGVGLGLSSVSPWTDSGVSASTFKNATGIYMVAVAVMASAMGGYWPPACAPDGSASIPTKCSSVTPRTVLSPGRSRPC